MQNDKIPESMGDTVPQLIIDIGTGERHVIQLRPRAGLTAAEAQAFLDGRIAEGKRIDPENCDVTRFCVETVDSYGLFEVPGEWSCVGNETFVRNPPDGEWVDLGDLPDEARRAVWERIDRAISRGRHEESEPPSA
jgi:hypothetical protein